MNTNEKPIASFRFPWELMAWIRKRSEARGWTVTEFVTRVLQIPQGYGGVPRVMAEALDADRQAMKMDEYDYLVHLLMRRYLEMREVGGPGFEKKERK